MPRFSITASVLALVLALAGCAHIEGVANTNALKPLPSSGTFAIELVAGEPTVAKKIERMVALQMESLGYKPAPQATRPTLRVLLAFDVVPEGTASTAPIILHGAARTTFVGGTAFTTQTPSTIIGGGGIRIFRKTIAINIVDGSTGDLLWEGHVSESGWCNQIFVTAPHILGLMFDRFPREATNVREVVVANDPRAERFTKLFPPDTDWSCGRPGG